jgi:hypothetical protein
MTAQTPNWQVDPTAARDEMEQGVDTIAQTIIALRQKLIAGGVGPATADSMCEKLFDMLMAQAGGRR